MIRKPNVRTEKSEAQAQTQDNNTSMYSRYGDKTKLQRPENPADLHLEGLNKR